MSENIFSCGKDDFSKENRQYVNLNTNKAHLIAIALETSGVPHIGTFSDDTMKLSEEQIERANTVNLPSFLMAKGFELKKVGREYVWKEHDSLHIKDNSPGERGVWHRFSNDTGGDNIAFLREYMNMSFVEAVEALNGEHYDRSYAPKQYAHTPKQRKAQAHELVLYENDDTKRVFAYLCKTRGLDYNLVKDLVKNGAIAQEQKTGNCQALLPPQVRRSPFSAHILRRKKSAFPREVSELSAPCRHSILPLKLRIFDYM